MTNTETLVLEYRQQANKNKAVPILADLHDMKPGEVANILFAAGEHVPTQFLSPKKRAEQYTRERAAAAKKAEDLALIEEASADIMPQYAPPKEPKAQPPKEPKAQPPKKSAVSEALAEASPEDRIAKCLRIIDMLLDRALADGTLFAAKIAAELVGDYLAIVRRLYEECASGLPQLAEDAK